MPSENGRRFCTVEPPDGFAGAQLLFTHKHPGNARLQRPIFIPSQIAPPLCPPASIPLTQTPTRHSKEGRTHLHKPPRGSKSSGGNNGKAYVRGETGRAQKRAETPRLRATTATASTSNSNSNRRQGQVTDRRAASGGNNENKRTFLALG